MDHSSGTGSAGGGGGGGSSGGLSGIVGPPLPTLPPSDFSDNQMHLTHRHNLSVGSSGDLSISEPATPPDFRSYNSAALKYTVMTPQPFSNNSSSYMGNNPHHQHRYSLSYSSDRGNNQNPMVTGNGGSIAASSPRVFPSPASNSVFSPGFNTPLNGSSGPMITPPDDSKIYRVLPQSDSIVLDMTRLNLEGNHGGQPVQGLPPYQGFQGYSQGLAQNIPQVLLTPNSSKFLFDPMEQQPSNGLQQHQQPQHQQQQHLGSPMIHRLSSTVTPPPSGQSAAEKSPASFLHVDTTEDKFPILVRRESSSLGQSPRNAARHSFGASSFMDYADSNPVFEDSDWSSTNTSNSNGPAGTPSSSNAGINHPNRRNTRGSSTGSLVGVSSPRANPGLGFVPSSTSIRFPSYYGYADANTAVSPHVNRMHSVSGSRGPNEGANSRGPNDRHSSQSSAAGAGSSRPQVRRNNETEAANKFANVTLESLINEIYSLCKDQHGCRFLQKKLEENNPVYTAIIFQETYPHVVELMTDPFGNYLCQKLLEHTNDEQRTIIVRTAAPDLVQIALNQHGTRALQKMIESVSTAEQVHIIVGALKTHVVKLIKDLNGNHVIQKCLNQLSPSDSQFIFDAVSENCIEVGTHRHGCCVLQRCIDHASLDQKQQVIDQIILNAFTLVQDPFGNYVAQYVLDLGDKNFSEPLIQRFLGHACSLSMQKFSSNVIEKCLRIAKPQTSRALMEEIVHSSQLEKLLRDSYANYVVQTALDYADPVTRQQLVEVIKPILPSIRSTPYGRRIQSKISGTGSCGPSKSPESNGNGNAYSYTSSNSTPLATPSATPSHSFQVNDHYNWSNTQHYSESGYKYA